MRRRITINRKNLEEFYFKKNLSPYKIAKIFNCSFSTITNRLKEHGISLKSKSQAQTIYPKFNFDGSNLDKAYMIGFRLGDLNVYKKKPDSGLVVVRCNTTSSYQISLINSLFAKYGQVTVCNSKTRGRNVNCYLDNSFSFLISKKGGVEPWIRVDDKSSIAFAAGYIDAEGSFLIDDKKGRFKVDSYDKDIIFWLYNWTKSKGLNAKLLLAGKKGGRRNDGTKFNHNLWRININEARSLYKFIKIIKSYLRHKKRLADLKKVERNLRKRKKSGTIN